MSRWAHFDDDGVCLWIVSHRPDDIEVYEVPDGLLTEDIWLDGTEIRTAQPLTGIPTDLAASPEPFSISLPDHTVGRVNGEYCGCEVSIPTDQPGTYIVEVLGAYRGVFRVRVHSYADLRREAYPPIEDQLDALWKGGLAAQDMMRRIQDVKSAFPKPDAEPRA